jgi:hypothetical protein
MAPPFTGRSLIRDRLFMVMKGGFGLARLRRCLEQHTFAALESRGSR